MIFLWGNLVPFIHLASVSLDSDFRVIKLIGARLFEKNYKIPKYGLYFRGYVATVSLELNRII